MQKGSKPGSSCDGSVGGVAKTAPLHSWVSMDREVWIGVGLQDALQLGCGRGAR